MTRRSMKEILLYLFTFVSVLLILLPMFFSISDLIKYIGILLAGFLLLYLSFDKKDKIIRVKTKRRVIVSLLFVYYAIYNILTLSN